MVYTTPQRFMVQHVLDKHEYKLGWLSVAILLLSGMATSLIPTTGQGSSLSSDETFDDYQQACKPFFATLDRHAEQLRSLLRENFEIVRAQ